MRIGALFLILVFLASGCGFHLQISQIRHEPLKYRDKEVIVKGQVVETLGIPFVQKGIFQVDDGTGKIWVVSQKRRPVRGDAVIVKGKVKTGFSIRGHSFGTAIVEADEGKRYGEKR